MIDKNKAIINMTSQELNELEQKVIKKIEKYQLSLQAIKKQKKIQIKKEKLEAKKAKNSKKQKNSSTDKIKNLSILSTNESKSLSKTEIEKAELEKTKLSNEDTKEQKSDKKKRKPKFLTIFITMMIMFLIGGSGVFAYYKVNYIKTIDFNGMNITEAKNWAAKNKVEILEEGQHSDEISENIIFQQSVNQNILINKNNNTLKLIYSLGPDLFKEIKIEENEFSDKTVDDIKEWLDKNYILNYDFEFILDSEIEPDKFVSFHVIDLDEAKDLPEFNRSQKFVFQFSMGDNPENFKDTTLIDFSDMEKRDIQIWLVRRGLIPKWEYDLSEEIEKDHVIGQNIPAGTSVEAGSEVVITLSQGSGVELPDFTKMTSQEASEFATENKIGLNIVYKYTNTYKKDSITKQNITQGTKVAENSIIILNVSLGKVQIPDFVTEGKNKSDVEKWLTKTNNYGGNIKISYKELWDESQYGNVISQSEIGEVYTHSTIEVNISKGPSINIPKFTTLNSVNEFKANNNVTLKIEKKYNALAEKNSVYDQSKFGTHSAGTTLTVWVSLGKVEVPDFHGKSKEEVDTFVKYANIDGANITINYTQEFSETIEPGYVMSNNSPGTFNPNIVLNITVSKGAGTKLINFNGKTKSWVENWCRNENLILEVIYVDHNQPSNSNIATDNDNLVGKRVDRGDKVYVKFWEPFGYLQTYENPALGFIGSTYEETKAKIKSHLDSQGFTNYHFHKVNDNKTSGYVVTNHEGYTLPGPYKLDHEINIYIQE